MTRVFEHPFSNVYFGSAENPAGPTGVSVLYFEGGATCVADLRGGAIAARDMGSVSLNDAWGEVDALCFTGGSVLGLGVTEGVVEVIQKTRGGGTDFDSLPAVPTVAIYDFNKRDNDVVPNAALGRAAMDAAKPKKINVGRCGAGVNASVGDYMREGAGEAGGQGAAHLRLDDINLLAFSVVNASGNILSLDGRVLRGNRDEGGKRESMFASLENQSASPSKANTVLTAVITDAALDRIQLSRLATIAHAGLGRVIEPFHTEYDGDVMFAISTAQKRLAKDTTLSDLGIVAARAAQLAVIDAVS